MQQDINKRLSPKEKEHTSIRMLYTMQRWAFRLYVGIVIVIFLVIAVSFIANQTAWGAFLLSSVFPWKWILPCVLLLGFLFIFTDTLLQSREEAWFRYYGIQVIATVTAFDEVSSFRWARRFFSDWTEYRLKLEWTSPDTGQIYHFSRRVRDRKLPVQGAQIPVVLDPADPTYYLQEDFKRSYN